MIKKISEDYRKASASRLQLLIFMARIQSAYGEEMNHVWERVADEAEAELASMNKEIESLKESIRTAWDLIGGLQGDLLEAEANPEDSVFKAKMDPRTVHLVSPKNIITAIDRDTPDAVGNALLKAGFGKNQKHKPQSKPLTLERLKELEGVDLEKFKDLKNAGDTQKLSDFINEQMLSGMNQYLFEGQPKLGHDTFSKFIGKQISNGAAQAADQLCVSPAQGAPEITLELTGKFDHQDLGPSAPVEKIESASPAPEKDGLDVYRNIKYQDIDQQAFWRRIKRSDMFIEVEKTIIYFCGIDGFFTSTEKHLQGDFLEALKARVGIAARFFREYYHRGFTERAAAEASMRGYLAGSKSRILEPAENEIKAATETKSPNKIDDQLHMLHQRLIENKLAEEIVSLVSHQDFLFENDPKAAPKDYEWAKRVTRANSVTKFFSRYKDQGHTDLEAATLCARDFKLQYPTKEDWDAAGRKNYSKANEKGAPSNEPRPDQKA